MGPVSPRAAVLVCAAVVAGSLTACVSLGGLAADPIDGGAGATDAVASGDGNRTDSSDDAGNTNPVGDGAPAGDGEAGTKACVMGKGPVMVRTDRGCIDTTEVTQKHYAEFLASPTPPAQPAFCAFNTTYVPGQTATGFICSASLYDPIGKPNAPVRCVDWCDANAFCTWAGKRLCGKIGGGVLPKTDFTDPAKSEWMSACSRGGTRAYPYGPIFTPGACHGETASSTPFDVQSAPSCIGGYPGLFDMSGNAAEWEDACDGTTGTADSCRIRGGPLSANPAGLACAADQSAPRGSFGATTGIRCCAD